MIIPQNVIPTDYGYNTRECINMCKTKNMIFFSVLILCVQLPEIHTCGESETIKRMYARGFNMYKRGAFYIKSAAKNCPHGKKAMSFYSFITPVCKRERDTRTLRTHVRSPIPY